MSTAETASTALARIVEPLAPGRAAMLRESFGAMFSKVEEWATEASLLQVTAEDQTGKMQRAKSLRLEIMRARTALDKKRADLKSSILVEGRAIDGAFRVFEGLASPIEKHLKTQEDFAHNAVKARQDALRDARASALEAHGVARAALPAALGELSAEAWAVVLADAQAAQVARQEAVRVAEEARVEAARIMAEREAQRREEARKADVARLAREESTRQENERLRAEAEKSHADRERIEADAREALAKERSAREESEAKAREDGATYARAAQAKLEEAQAAIAESASREKALRDAAAQAAERQRAELESKKPTKAKYAVLLTALRQISAWSTEPIAAARAAEALKAVGEGVES